MRIRHMAWAVAATMLGVAGCRSNGVDGGGCSQPREYTDSNSIPPLKVPAGFDGLQTRNAMSVPDLNTPERPRSPDEPCLDVPPKVPTATKAAPPAR